MKYFLVLFVAGISIMGWTPVTSAQSKCSADGDVSYICEARNVEDLILIRNTGWVLAGRLPSGDANDGGFYLINIHDNSLADFVPDFSGAAQDIYAACPGAPDPDLFMVHGLSIRYGKSGHHQVYVVYHGERESVEVFALDVSGKRPTLTWKGCVIAPENAALNSVTPLPAEGFAVTSIMTATDPESFDKLMAGEPSGFVAEWSPGASWVTLPGTEFSGNNGIVASADGSTLFVAAWGNNALQIVGRGDANVARRTINLGDLHPDNIRHAPDGSLLIAGQTASMTSIFDCIRTPATVCPMAYKVVKVNPHTFAVETLVDVAGTEKFGGATTAILVEDEIWIGTFRGTRIARFKLEN